MSLMKLVIGFAMNELMLLDCIKMSSNQIKLESMYALV